MDRRTFVLLAGAGSTTLLGPSLRVAARPPQGRRAQLAGRLRFELNDERQWSLWYLGEGSPVPLLLDATLGAWIRDQFVTLGDVEYSTVGTRRPPGGDALVMRGRVAGTYLEAEFLAGPPAAAPLATISVTITPDRDLPSIKGVRFFQALSSDVMPGSGAPVALVNGSTSHDGARLIAVPPPADFEVASYGAFSLMRDARALALAFDPDDPGWGTVTLSRDGLDVVSDWAPARPVRPDGDTSRLRLCYQPAGDAVEALRMLFLPTSLVDQERLARLPAPAGWTTGGALGATISEADIINHATFCAERFDRGLLRVIEVGDGYQRAAGDWDTNDRFPQGHRWLTDQIHSRKLQAGLWLAPFAVSERCGIPAAHPDWLVRNGDDTAPAVLATRDDWGGQIYALDGAHPAVRRWLSDLAHTVVQEWGYDCLRLDRLQWATTGSSHYGGLTPAEACRLGLGALRDGAGSNAFLFGCDAPLQHSVGLVNGMRIGPDADGGWSGVQAPARAAALRSFYSRGVWLNDPGALMIGPPLSLAEARLWTSIVAVSGDITVLADDITKLDPERLEMLARMLPVALSSGRPIAMQPDVWITEGAPNWWTVVLANWGDDAMQQSVPLADLGLTGARFNAYDVWRAAPIADLTDNLLSATIDPHSCLTVSIRPAAARPQLVGTTRHVVQGAVDVVDEEWDAVTRTLRARATNLDRRAYGVTIAVPKGLRPGTCKADRPCSVRTLESGHAVIEWAAATGGDGSDVDWALTFRRAGAAGTD
jgi:Melibiase